jgi:hypothetical protein
MTDDEKSTLIELFLSPDTTNFMVAVEILKGQEPLDIYSTLISLRKAGKELASSNGATQKKAGT